uniref:Uncharacterized protein n=1 Tax=Lactuca sativa TaxID=4236 RepID=A0A9R1XMD4_LACSA|nr:hypothetical protein LSAT_V11C400211440 [Lactuca sativa]
MERRLINTYSGESLSDMMPTKIRELMEKMAIQSKHSENEEDWYFDQPKVVKEVNSHHLEAQIYELTKAFLLLTKEKSIVYAKKQCGIYLKTEHPTDMCPLLQEDTTIVKVVGGYQQNFQKNFQQRR